MRPNKEPMTEERRQQLIIGAAPGAMNIYKFLRRRNSPNRYLLIAAQHIVASRQR
jgi:hypothetical protein